MGGLLAVFRGQSLKNGMAKGYFFDAKPGFF